MPVRGMTLCDQHALEFSAVFAQQFRLEKVPGLDLPGFTKTQLGPWQLQVGPDLPLAELNFSSGTGRLVFLGLAVDPEGEVVTSDMLARKCAPWFDTEQLIAWLNRCAGRFAFAITCSDVQRFYIDPMGSLGAVYDAGAQAIASTLNLVLARDLVENRSYPVTDEAVRELGRFGFGHTPDENVKRLIPNHYLDLTDFREHRFWPLPGDIVEPDEDRHAGLVEEIVARLRQVMDSLARHVSPTYLPMSGGLDSRLLLAAAKPSLERIQLFSHAENQMSRKDTRIAARLAQLVGAPLTIIDPIRDPAYQIDDPQRLESLSKAHQIATGIGIIGDEVPRIRHEVLLAHPPGGLMLRGNGSDFLKAVLWRRGVREYSSGADHNFETGIRMMMLSDKSIIQNPDIQTAYRDWYSDFSGVAARRAYDFMFAEQFLSHGLGNQMYAMTNNFYVCPFNDRMMLGGATCLPPDRRARLQYNLMILDRHAPELQKLHYARNAVNQHLKAMRQSLQDQESMVT